MLCIGSGKGGVGKSTLTANLAAALTAEGKRVGILDADVWGYSIPRMYGLGATRPPVSRERKIIPLEAHGVKVMSIGFFVEEDAAVVWRGPMLHKALTQFLQDVDWGALDYLLVDLPPGTGDVSMTLAQLLPQAQFLIVTTPQPTAQKVARRAAQMAHKVELEIGGVIENMSSFTTPSGERFTIFGEGGGQELADELDVPLLGKVPLTMPLREQADGGVPLVIEDPDDPASQAIRQAARGLIAMAPLRAAGAAAGRGRAGGCADPGGQPETRGHVAADGLSQAAAPTRHALSRPGRLAATSGRAARTGSQPRAEKPMTRLTSACHLRGSSSDVSIGDSKRRSGSRQRAAGQARPRRGGSPRQRDGARRIRRTPREDGAPARRRDRPLPGRSRCGTAARASPTCSPRTTQRRSSTASTRS